MITCVTCTNSKAWNIVFSFSEKEQANSNQQKAPRTQKPKKSSKCCVCKQFSSNLSYVNNIQGSITVQKKSIPQKDILLKTIPAQNVLTPNQIAQLKKQSTNFAPKFCKACLTQNFSRGARIDFVKGCQ